MAETRREVRRRRGLRLHHQSIHWTRSTNRAFIKHLQPLRGTCWKAVISDNFRRNWGWIGSETSVGPSSLDGLLGVWCKRLRLWESKGWLRHHEIIVVNKLFVRPYFVGGGGIGEGGTLRFPWFIGKMRDIVFFFWGGGLGKMREDAGYVFCWWTFLSGKGWHVFFREGDTFFGGRKMAPENDVISRHFGLPWCFWGLLPGGSREEFAATRLLKCLAFACQGASNEWRLIAKSVLSWWSVAYVFPKNFQEQSLKKHLSKTNSN